VFLFILDICIFPCMHILMFVCTFVCAP
jgi:hypothetical protein